MFTGIVEEIGRVAAADNRSLTVNAELTLEGVALGHSLAVNGVCLTVTHFDNKSFTADVMAETFRRSNLGKLKTGDYVNLERAMQLGGHLGGHLVQGHIDATGAVARISAEGEAKLITVKAPPEVMTFVVEKGFIAVDGVSLTVTKCDAGSFQVSVVGFTRDHTTLGRQKTGGTLNLEVDIIAKYVARLTGAHSGGITPEFLQEHGYPSA
jgi:riboflavin synthase